ncbi:adenosylcobinamide-GDP ribazoletransferase [Paenibacillus glycanilyticus]|uniref:Adenosylcobinamide-GDP ribazoletransferase n=1 Tax=Paenibacillus glycanilyticus TaxID=126569 RepID=A0ABQ6GJU2_9BACL|nr:adenosylcobinamide-GDP ribazoletransferase [Paenibacillus glycanilyticus]GLX70770.1 adenosylcobinamide-GDP ribazoletransferase [Paenibacillus glycanilyticus]
MVNSVLKKHGQAVALALQFLTRIPVPVAVPFEPVMLARTVIYFPAAGVIVGAVLVGGFALLELVSPSMPAAVLLLAIWTALSGGLHLDGWMDTADGVLSHRSRERMLEIMKDSRVGAMGVIAAVLLLLFKFSVLDEWLSLGDSTHRLSLLLIIPVWSRWWMGAAIADWPNARQGEGIGALFHLASRRHVATGLVLAILISLVCLSLNGLDGLETLSIVAGCLILTIVTGSLMAMWLNRKLGGLTGDTYGAMNEAVEAVLLFAALLAIRVI